MRKPLSILSALLTLFLSIGSRPLHAESYLCVVSEATGFVVNETTNQWRMNGVSVSDKYLIRDAKDNEGDKTTKGGWVVTKVGEKMPSMFCENWKTKLSRVECTGVGVILGSDNSDPYGNSYFVFNKQTLRFLYGRLAGYVDKEPERSKQTPYLARGECSPL